MLLQNWTFMVAKCAAYIYVCFPKSIYVHLSPTVGWVIFIFKMGCCPSFPSFFPSDVGDAICPLLVFTAFLIKSAQLLWEAPVIK